MTLAMPSPMAERQMAVKPLRVAIICPVVVQHDAISAAAYDTYQALVADRRFEPIVLTCKSDFPEIRAQIVHGAADLLTNSAYLQADVLLYHFGVYNEVFDTLLLGNGRARRVVYFHNITPLEFVPPTHRSVIRQSFQQLWNLKHADEIWPVSPVNERELLDRGFDPSRLHAAPLAVETPSLSYLEQKALSPVDILFVGRIVRAKGVLDLLQGLGQVHRQFASAIRVRIVGNVSFSDRAYVDAVRAAIATAGFPVEFLGTVDDERLHQLYRSSHVLAIPSYHEGFCKPVVEALRAGCIPVGYSAHNLPNVAGGLGRLVATGDIAALGEALAQVVDGVAQALASPERECLVLDRGEMSARGFDREAKRHVEVFSFDKFAETARHRIVALSGNGVGHPHG